MPPTIRFHALHPHRNRRCERHEDDQFDGCLQASVFFAWLRASARARHLKTDEESLDASFGAWRRVATNVILVDRGQTQAWRVEPRELAAAIAKDVAESLDGA